MEERIIEFAGVLRRNGIRVSLSENMDAFRALELIGIGDPLLFRNALRNTLLWAAMYTAIPTVIGLAVALLVDSEVRGEARCGSFASMMQSFSSRAPSKGCSASCKCWRQKSRRHRSEQSQICRC